MPIAELPNVIPALPEIFMAIAAMALLMVGVFHGAPRAATASTKAISGKSGAAKTGRLVSNLGVIVLLLTVLLVVTISGGRMVTFENMFVVDTFAVYFKILILIGSAFCLVLSQDYMERHGSARFEYAIVILLASVGMMMMVSANSLISLYIGLEMQSLSLYILAAFRRDDLRSSEAGVKYFVLGALASGMLLYGASLIYGFSGAVDFAAIAGQIKHAGTIAPGMTIGVVFILAGLAFKVSAVPFHMWTPDVYEGAPTPVTAFFSIGPKLAAIALLIRVLMDPFGDLSAQWQQIVIVIAIASMLLGAFAAINQRNIKRMMAYSSIGHVGYALIGVAVGNASGVNGVLVYMAIYLFMNVGTFACILTMRRGDRMVENIYDLAGLSRTNPFVAAAMAVFMFSMAGIPPLAGFFGKLYIFLSAIEAHLYALAVIGVLASVVSAFFYIRIVKIMYFDAPGEPLETEIGRGVKWVILISMVAILVFFIYPSALLNVASVASRALF
ncbi:NADH-quinone oxidoreductase subunit NuoN [Varunaivibrio sulfuroxidans]|uniref:NADH-quinone oxidoreductase subunit N n=1 Tax=Varunaivibrio sulfuroxidans TaxID=1773489 RepID=A0A4R3JEC8_9PROT|nr:NADH-quinone oxidoreductase subunit NuoN [Varunaivibrio sulfuroxidans]TCS64137.1 NADH dehydrogenase subunit N [Varunaivibrio sulfuroxidans]WES31416.1 NADH-quinone oxidoreductase subunit NuoN [Varunaivibrio sulfuroxidans]